MAPGGPETPRVGRAAAPDGGGHGRCPRAVLRAPGFIYFQRLKRLKHGTLHNSGVGFNLYFRVSEFPIDESYTNAGSQN